MTHSIKEQMEYLTKLRQAYLLELKILEENKITFYSIEKVNQILNTKIEWRNIMGRHTTIYESDLLALINSHKNSIKDAREDVEYYALMNDDKLVAYYEGRIVSLQLSLNQLRNLRKSLFSN